MAPAQKPLRVHASRKYPLGLLMRRSQARTLQSPRKKYSIFSLRIIPLWGIYTLNKQSFKKQGDRYGISANDAE
jgi:hypothetical protein